MPPREQDLPEGTDKVIAGASKTDTSTGTGSGGPGGGNTASGGGNSGGGNSGGGFVASSSGGGTGATDKIVTQVRDQVYSLREQATGKAREFADTGKDRTTQILDDIAEIIHDAARSIDDRLGDQYGEYAHKAGDAVQGLAGGLRDKSMEDLIEGTRSIVKKSPAVTVGTAALLGFVLVRLVRSGLESGDGSGNSVGNGRSGGGNAGNTGGSNAGGPGNSGNKA